MWSFILGLLGCNNVKSQSEKISLEKIEELFSNMKANGTNTDSTMLWGYFFTSNSRINFEKVANDLKEQNFEFVEIYQSEDGSFWLHLERKEIHNPKSLFELDEKLYAIADKYKINYDGFDVGNVDKNKPIERNTYVVPEEFKAIDYQQDNFPFFLVGNIAFDNFPHKDEFKFFIKITLPHEKDNKALLPTNSELEELDNFEHFIENNLTQNNINNYYVFRNTYKGIRTFYIVTNDNNGAHEVLKLIKNSAKQRDFEFEIIIDKDWKFYQDFRERIAK